MAADVSISKALRSTAKSGEQLNGTEGVRMIKANLLRAATAVLCLRGRHSLSLSLTASIIDFYRFQLFYVLVCLSLTEIKSNIRSSLWAGEGCDGNEGLKRMGQYR